MQRHIFMRLDTVRNEVAKVMFLQACVCPQGGCLLCTEAPHSRERRLLLRTVRILLECILVAKTLTSSTFIFLTQQFNSALNKI